MRTQRKLREERKEEVLQLAEQYNSLSKMASHRGYYGGIIEYHRRTTKDRVKLLVILPIFLIIINITILMGEPKLHDDLVTVIAVIAMVSAAFGGMFYYIVCDRIEQGAYLPLSDKKLHKLKHSSKRKK